MPNLRIAVGYLTDHRKSEGVVLAASFDQAKLQAAVDQAKPEFLRFEFGIFGFARGARRSGKVVEPLSSEEVKEGEAFEQSLVGASPEVWGQLARLFPGITLNAHNPSGAFQFIADEFCKLGAENERLSADLKLLAESSEKAARAGDAGNAEMERLARENNERANAAELEVERLKGELEAANTLLAEAGSKNTPTTAQPAAGAESPGLGGDAPAASGGGGEAGGGGPQVDLLAESVAEADGGDAKPGARKPRGR
jgi:hypothetical protein